MTKPEKRLELIGPVLERMLEQAGVLPQVKQYQAASYWSEEAGKRLADGVKAVRVTNGVLWVHAKGPQWAAELALRKKEILDRLNKRAGETILTDIRAVGAWDTGRTRR